MSPNTASFSQGKERAQNHFSEQIPAPKDQKVLSKQGKNYSFFTIPARSQIQCQVLSHVFTTNNSVTGVIILILKATNLKLRREVTCPRSQS